LHFCYAAENLGEVWRLRQGNSKNPLLDAVDVLEWNWKLAWDVLQLTRHVLIHMFVGLFPKKKDEMPAANLQKLVAAFDTIEDPVRAMKLTSVKRSVEGAISLAQSHGEEVDWEKCNALPFEKGRTPGLSATPWITDSTIVQNIVIIVIVSRLQLKSSYISLRKYTVKNKVAMSLHLHHVPQADMVECRLEILLFVPHPNKPAHLNMQPQ
jgi:hypothetical protein